MVLDRELSHRCAYYIRIYKTSNNISNDNNINSDLHKFNNIINNINYNINSIN